MRVPAVLRIVAAAFGLTTAVPVVAQEQVIDFDDLPWIDGFLPGQFHGFTFDGGMGYDRGQQASWVLVFPGGRGDFVPRSGHLAIWSNGGTYLTMSRLAPFNLLSVYATARESPCRYGPGNPTQVVTGYRHGAVVGSVSLVVDCLHYQKHDLNLTNVDMVRFDEGKPRAFNLLLDDIVYSDVTAVPEPSTVGLMTIGLVGIGMMVGRRVM
jgi:hypothetical protein